MISCKEVFCSELPSPSSIFHSSSNNSNNDANTTTNGLYYQFASERHSLTLQTNTCNAQEDEGEKKAPSKKTSKNNKRYTMSAERLLQKSKREKHPNKEDSSSSNTTTTTICSAHSSMQRDNISIRAFAIRIKETITNPTQQHHHHHSSNSTSSQDDQATVDTHYNSLGGTHSGSGSATNINNKEVATTGNAHGGDGSTGGEIADKKFTSSGDQGMITSSSSKYALMIKYHQLVNANNKEGPTTATKTEQINLDFRPISVHVTQLHSSLSSSSSSASEAENEENGLLLPIIGVFVSGDDNKLHFFVATMQALKERLFQTEERVKEATSTPENSQCFQPTLCFETIDPSNIISTTDSNINSEYHSLSSEESADDNPLMFETNIMAIDTYVSDSHGEMMKMFSSPSSPSSVTNSTTADKVNRLAVACYDGVIHILTYTIECPTLDAKNLVRITKLQYSTFIVDGPVATLDFHCNKITKNSRQVISDCDSLKEEENSCNNLFLLAGSLCGLAFLFYEVPPSTTSAMEGDSFQGPVVVVDGLYDADGKEGFEDCVTAVHVMRYHDVTILAVGTQGCRLLLFQQHQQHRNQSTGNEAIKEHDKQKALLTAEMDNKTEEMMHLSSERDRLTNVVTALREKLLELENNDHEEDVLHADTTITPSDSGIENDGGGDDVKANLVNADCTSNASAVERLQEDALHEDATITPSDSGIENDGGGDDVKANLVNADCTSNTSAVERLQEDALHEDATITPSDSAIENDEGGDDVKANLVNEGCTSNTSAAERLQEDALHEDATITPSDSGIENDGGGDDVKANLVNEGCISNASAAERLNSIKAEIDDAEQSRSKCTYIISQLQSSIDDLTDKLKDLSIPSPQLDLKSVRKLYRYEYLWEHKLPYPIQAIGSAVCAQSDLECFVTTRQTIHIFRLLSSQMVDAAAALLERKLRSFSNTTEDRESQ